MQCSTGCVGLDAHGPTTLTTVRQSSGEIIARSLPKIAASATLCIHQTAPLRLRNRVPKLASGFNPEPIASCASESA
jgi:hypothetical protein